MSGDDLAGPRVRAYIIAEFARYTETFAGDAARVSIESVVLGTQEQRAEIFEAVDQAIHLAFLAGSVAGQEYLIDQLQPREGVTP